MHETTGWTELRDLVASAGVLVVTGAGISTDSGIPDYRGPTGSLRHALPMTYQRFTSGVDERRRYWARSHLGWLRMRHAEPNAAHHAVAHLERVGLVDGVVTQNVDGLHAAAGSREVVDLHGRLDTVVCLDCGEREDRTDLAGRLARANPGFEDRVDDARGTDRPDGDVVLDDDAVAGFVLADCLTCDGPLKPDVVFFGEHVPRERFARALGMLDAASSLLVLGSSLQVGSGFRFVTAAKRRGLPVAIVNRGVTRGDRHADLKLDAGLGDVLPPLSEALVGRGTAEARG